MNEKIKYKEDCIFCKIAKGIIPCAKIWEDEKYLAFLDRSPNVKGMTLVIPKEHYDSNIMEMPEESYLGLMLAGRTVQQVIKKGLNLNWVNFVGEGLLINHAHLKLYPAHGVNGFQSIEAKDRIYFEKYEGYVSTQLGPDTTLEERLELAKLIRGEK